MGIIFCAHVIVAVVAFFYILNESKKQEKKGGDLAFLALLIPPIAVGQWSQRSEDDETVSKTYLFWTAFSKVNVFFFGLLIVFIIIGDPLSMWSTLSDAASGPSTPIRDTGDLVSKGVGAGLFVIGAGFSFLVTLVMILFTAAVGCAFVFVPLGLRGDKYIRPITRS